MSVATIPPLSHASVSVRPAKKLFSPREAAEMLGISTRSLWTLTNCGKIASVRVGKLVKYSEADVDAFIAENRS